MADLHIQKKLAATISGRSIKDVHINFDRLAEVGVELDEFKQAITKQDVRGFIKDGVITIAPKKGVSRSRAKKIRRQKSKGLQRGHGSRKGVKTARLPSKKSWISRVRLQREFLAGLRNKELISTKDYRALYLKSKGGFFRSLRHMKLYMDEHKFITKKQ